MAARTLAAFIRARMAVMRTDTVQIERDYPKVPADWIRGLMAGRGVKQPNRERIKGLAMALGVEEAELWRYLGRFDRIAELRNEPPADMPAWAVRLEEKVDALSEALTALAGGVGEVDRLTRTLAGLVGKTDRERLASFGLQVRPIDTALESPAPAERDRPERTTNG